MQSYYKLSEPFESCLYVSCTTYAKSDPKGTEIKRCKSAIGYKICIMLSALSTLHIIHVPSLWKGTVKIPTINFTEHYWKGRYLEIQ